MRTSLTALLLIGACSSGTKSPTATPTAPPDNGSGEPAHTACTTDADCVIVETACCDHCNGGSAEAFNTAFADAHRPTGCEGTACTKRGCGDAVASCDAGTCKATIAPL